MNQPPHDNSHPPFDAAVSTAVLTDEVATDETKLSEGEESLWQLLARRIVRIGALPPVLRVLFIATLAQLVLVGVLLATQRLPQPMVIDGFGGEHELPLTVYVLVMVSWVFAWTFALSDAMRIPWLPRLLVLSVCTFVLGFVPLFAVFTLARHTSSPYTDEFAVRKIQLAVVAAIWLWVGVVSALSTRGRAHAVGMAKRPTLHWVGPLGVFVLIALYYALDWRVLNIYATAGVAQSQLSVSNSNMQIVILGLFLAFAIYWASTDLIEMGQVATKSVVHLTSRLGSARGQLALAGLTIAVSAYSLFAVLRFHTLVSLFPGVLVALVLTGLVVVLVRFAVVDTSGPGDLPVLALLAGATLTFVYLQVASTVGIVLLKVQGRDLGNLSLTTMLDAGAAILGLTCGLALLAYGRARATAGAISRTSIVGLFLALVALALLELTIPRFVSAFGGTVPLSWSVSFPVLRVLGSIAALGLVGWYLVRGRDARTRRWMQAALLFLIGLQVADWIIGNLDPTLDAAKATSAFVAAALFLLAFSWDLLTAGSSGLNEDTPRYPRAGAVLLYLSYTLLASSTLLYVSTDRSTKDGSPVAFPFIGSDVNAFGIWALGVPFVVFAVIVAVRPRRARERVARRASMLPLGLSLLGGGVAIVLLALVSISVILPRVPKAKTAANTVQFYAAAVPGPAPCDTGGALWTVAKLSLSCSSAGAHIRLAPGSSGTLLFTQPGNAFPRDYRESIQVDMSHAGADCVALQLRVTTSGGYLAGACATGDYVIYSGNSTRFLASGALPRIAHKTIVITATIQGSTITLALDGKDVAQVIDSSFTTTTACGLSILGDDRSATELTLSNFSFTPLS